jgi:aryl-phospho-beta-D-glucosidase BglC (GH1 family)
MKINFFFSVLLLLISLATVVSCGNEGAAEPVLKVSANEVTLSGEGGQGTITIESNGEWTINNVASWLSLSQAGGDSGTFTVNVTALSGNETGASRSTVLVVNSSKGQARRVTVVQSALIYPSYNTTPKAPDASGMVSTAVELAEKMGLGINIGNTLEAPGGENGWEGNNQGWNPMITEEYVLKLKENGFKSVRLPCAWDMTHVMDEDKARIDPNWMARVKEVIGYCVENDMYVLLNIHWDGGWLDHNINKAKQDSVNAKQKAYWEQIATAMRDFDEYLLFASANEPPAEDAEQMQILETYHQTFVDAVRSTGGKNSYRVLVVQGPATDIEKTYNLMDNLPTDQVEDRMMAEIHYYTPSQFCLLYNGDASWGKMFYYWGEENHSSIEPDRNATWGEEDEVNKNFDMMKTKFVDKGVPVILGEYGAYRRSNLQYLPQDMEAHNASVDHWIRYVTQQATNRGFVSFFWETGGMIDRSTATVKDQRSLDALIAGGPK